MLCRLCGGGSVVSRRAFATTPGALKGKYEKWLKRGPDSPEMPGRRPGQIPVLTLSESQMILSLERKAEKMRERRAEKAAAKIASAEKAARRAGEPVIPKPRIPDPPVAKPADEQDLGRHSRAAQDSTSAPKVPASHAPRNTPRRSTGGPQPRFEPTILPDPTTLPALNASPRPSEGPKVVVQKGRPLSVRKRTPDPQASRYAWETGDNPLLAKKAAAAPQSPSLAAAQQWLAQHKAQGKPVWRLPPAATDELLELARANPRDNTVATLAETFGLDRMSVLLLVAQDGHQSPVARRTASEQRHAEWERMSDSERDQAMGRRIKMLMIRRQYEKLGKRYREGDELVPDASFPGWAAATRAQT